MIEIAALRVVFGRTVALDGIDLALDPGVIGVFGPNGSGKTTLLRVLAGLLRPTSGTVRVGGDATTRGESFRRMVGYAGHEPGLYGDLSPAENLSLFARLYGVDESRVTAMLAAVGLQDRAGARVHDLSAGLARRAAVARAILHDPEILLMDEPYANLDDDAAGRVSDAVREWWKPGRIALIATHGAKRVKAYAHGGVILRDGRVQVAGAYGRKEET